MRLGYVVPVLFTCVQVYSDLPPLHIGDTVCVTTDDRKLAQVYSLEEEVGQYFSMVRNQRRFSVDNLMFGIQLADILTRCYLP